MIDRWALAQVILEEASSIQQEKLLIVKRATRAWKAMAFAGMDGVNNGLAEGGAPNAIEHGSGAAVGGTSPELGEDWRDSPVPDEDTGTRGLMEAVEKMNEKNMQMMNLMLNQVLEKQ